MVSKTEISVRYDRYLKSFSDAKLIKYGEEDVDRPTKKSLTDEEFGIDIRDASINGSRDILLSYDERRAGIRYLSPELYPWIAVELTEVLQANVCADHEAYWWFTHDFARAVSEESEIFSRGLIENLELIIRLVLSQPLFGFSPEKKSANEILWEAKTLATYLAYPTLEGVVKNACRRDIGMGGEIKDGRRIRKLGPNRTFMDYADENGDGIYSNFGGLLWHLEKEVANPQNATHLREMRKQVADMYDEAPPELVLGMLNGFRNDSLHGRNQAAREYGVLLNYICLVIWITLLP